MKEIQSAQRNKPSCKDLLSVGIALSQLHCCGLSYGGRLKNNNEKTESAADRALNSLRSWEEHQSTENELTPERCPWLSEVTATINRQLRALPQPLVGCEQPPKCYVEGFSLFIKTRHSTCLFATVPVCSSHSAQQCKFNTRWFCSSNTQQAAHRLRFYCKISHTNTGSFCRFKQVSK